MCRERAQHSACDRHWTEKLLIDVAAKDRTLSDLTSSREADATKRTEKVNRLQESEVFVRTEREKRELEKRRRERVELEVRMYERLNSTVLMAPTKESVL